MTEKQPSVTVKLINSGVHS